MKTSQQTQNFINLCRGGNPNSINQLLQFQSKGVLEELYSSAAMRLQRDFIIYNTKDLREISIRLSGGF